MGGRHVILPASFYARTADQVARDLLGCVLVCPRGGVLCSGRIVEAEGYQSDGDSACHATRGRTERNAPMFGPPGTAYVYFTYGMHWLLNAVCNVEGVAEAALIRAIEPIHGIDAMRRRRGDVGDVDLCRGPARLVQALGITSADNRRDLTAGRVLWIEAGEELSDGDVVFGRRVGVGRDVRPLRFCVRGSRYVSRPAPRQ